MGATLRRLGLRSLVRVRREQLREAAGKHQFGVCTKAGAQLLHKCLQALAETRPDAAFLKVDMRAAFQTMERQPALAALAACVPELAAACEAWYNSPSEHLSRKAAGHFEKVTSSRGFDQGCPLSPGAFSVGQRTVLEPFLEKLKQLDPEARMFSFLDDSYFVLSKETLALALAGLQEAFAPLGMTLNPRKTLIWSPSGPSGLPEALAPHWVDSLPVLGAYLRTPGSSRDAPESLGAAGAGLATATATLTNLWQQLQRLVKAGLSKQAAGALLKAYAGPGSQYPLQLEHTTQEEAKRYDAVLVRCWEDLAERPFSSEATTRLGLPTKLGGCGVQLASTRCHAAFWATWTAALDAVTTELGHATVADCLDTLPALSAKLAAARQGLADQGMVLSAGADLADALRQPYPQRLLVGQVQKKLHAALLQTLHTPQPAEARGAGGPGAASFLQYPVDASCSMENVFWSAALRQRLALERAELSQAELTNATNTCCCRNAQGHTCGAQLDKTGFHALTDQNGGGVLVRHNRLAKAVGGLLTRWRRCTPLFEQRVPTWDRPRRRLVPGLDPVERAILDIEYAADDGRRWIDVTVRHPAAGDAAAVQACARRDGEASRRAERSKHDRYPGEQLTAFAVETPGRVGAEARLWLLSEVRQLPQDMQTAELSRAYRVISCALQTEVVRQLRRAAGVK